MNARTLPLAALAIAAAAPVRAQGDELQPVPAAVLLGRPYPGQGAASRILFINVRPDPVWLSWIARDGSRRLYGVIAPGGEWRQPTFVTHRWVATDRDGGPIAAFISTRAAMHDDGVPQIALIR